MFLDFYNLREQPFGVTPNPAYLYLSQTHREALASLYYGIENERGFLALIARPGMGKTTLLFQLLERLRNPCRTVFLFQTQCNSREFLRYLLSDLGYPALDGDLVSMHLKLNETLIREAKSNKRFVLVVDEAQNLDNPVLETVRLLSDFETPRRKLMQIILSGQPELARKLLHRDLSQLRQRLSIIGRLAPLSPEEINQYIDHRLKLAGWEGGTLFDDEARALIVVHSHGIPREVNNLCFNALSLGFAQRQKRIGGPIMKEVVNDLDIRPLTSHSAADMEGCSTMEAEGGGLSPSNAAPGKRFQVGRTPVGSFAQTKSGGKKRISPLTAMAAVLLLGVLLLLLSLKGKWLAGQQGELAPLPAAGKSVTPAPGLVTPTETVPGSRSGGVQASESPSGQQGTALLSQPRPANPPADPAGNMDKKTEEVAVHSDSEISSHPDLNSSPASGALPYFTLKVVRNQTLRKICLRRLGRYDPKLLDEIHALNPDLDNPDFILAGQELRLPIRAKSAPSLQQANSDISRGIGH